MEHAHPLLQLLQLLLVAVKLFTFLPVVPVSLLLQPLDDTLLVVQGKAIIKYIQMTHTQVLKDQPSPFGIKPQIFDWMSMATIALPNVFH